jgi:hypothetical protein
MVITIAAIIKLMGTGFGISDFYPKLMQIISQDFYVIMRKFKILCVSTVSFTDSYPVIMRI